MKLLIELYSNVARFIVRKKVLKTGTIFEFIFYGT